MVVTGTAGFIGKKLKQRLESMGHSVIGWEPSVGSKGDVFSEFTESLGDTIPEAIFHVGADSNTLAIDVNSVMSTNYYFTRALMQWANGRQVKVIYSSSAACYGGESGLPENLYAWSKFAGEDYVGLMGGVSLRYFNVYGPGENHKGEMASFVYQAWKGWQQGHTPMLFPLNPKRDFVHVDDVIMANIAALDSFSELAGYYFEVGTGQARSFEDCLSIFDIPWSYTDE